MPTRDGDALRESLERIDGRGYKAYKSIAGVYRLDALTLFIDHVQGDPFASPSKLRLRLPHEMPKGSFASRIRRVALEDYLARRVRDAIQPRRGRRGTGKSGLVTIDAGGQEVLERTAVVVKEDWVEARIEVGLPAAGRNILGREAERLLLDELPRLARAGLGEPIADEGVRFVDTVDNHDGLVTQLADRGLVAFVADGASLPRASGASDRPMPDAVPFHSPESLRVTLELRHAVDGTERLSGMGVPTGVTLIVGGGYHGKSTLLKAIERGVYPHVPGDGREYVATRHEAVKIRAEDGRRVAKVDISPFIRELPMGRSTKAFSTEDASGSTSQAANIIEALEAGASVLLLDEDTSATNFMVRDARMQALVAREDEPIVPFVDRVRELADARSVSASSVIVMGGSGDYFEAADTVIRMKDYAPEDVTTEAKRIAASRPTGREGHEGKTLVLGPDRTPVASSIDASRGRREVKIEARGRDLLQFGSETIDLRAVEQLVDPSQTRAVGFALKLGVDQCVAEGASVGAFLDAIEALFDQSGLDPLSPFAREGSGEHPGNFARPRRFEIAAALNRLRTLRVE